MTQEEAKNATIYTAGFDAGKNGANPENCNFRLFDTPEHTKLWEQGRDEGLKQRPQAT